MVSLSFSSVFAAARARAQGPLEGSAAALPPSDAPGPQPIVVPPKLKEHVDPSYPPEALRERLSGSVQLELTVDEDGHVSDARVLHPAGHGFDDAALIAVKNWTFEPALQNGKPIHSTVELTLPFEPPAPAAEPAPNSSGPVTANPPPAPVPRAEKASETTLVLARRPISAASSSTAYDRDFALRPIASVQDILRVTPGLLLVQHSGGGKANQYFLRGFDADHGTDLALSIDGIPINLPSHAHGQGFSDTNFIIPETVERVQISKGPYFANQSDFATAGAVNLVTRDGFEHSSAGFGVGGSPGHGGPSYRALLIASPKWEQAKAIFAADLGRQDGPFDHPEGWDHYKLFNKLTVALTPTSSVSVGEASYSGDWHGSGQIPARAVEEGLISRFGSLDPSEGGNTARHQVFASYRLRPTEASEIAALAYAGTYRFNLFSNFTLYLDDPLNGDEIEQVDRRTFYGGTVSYRVLRELGRVRFDTSIGGSVRNDDIHEELWHTRDRVELAQTRGNNVAETLLGAYLNEEITPLEWLRFDLGARTDLLSFAVENRLASADPSNPRSGVDAASQLSPKASAVVTPLADKDAELELYLNYGHGFHSNDVRGVFTTPSVTPLVRAVGEEVGARGRLWQRLDLAAAAWLLDLNNETTWNGDDGTTNVSPATRRYGIELEGRYELTPWLAADGAVTFTHSQFTADRENGGGLALAPKQTWSGGLSARHEIGPGVGRAGLRFFGIGERPASDDGALVAPGFTQVDAHIGFRQRWYDVAFDVENLFNGVFRSAQFATVSRLGGEPGIGQPVPAGFRCGSRGRLASNPNTGLADGAFWGCEDVNYTPAYPLTLRVMATLFLD
ncbi:MAG TPA: TonB-dependent receptor [Polyangiaceae bacterium]|jgi:TonB family protein